MTDEKKELINNLLQNLGIYCSVDQISQDNIKEVFGFKRVSNALDLFCPQCNQDKTFVLDRVSGSDIDGDFVINHYVYCNVNLVSYKCPTCGKKIIFVCLYDNNKLIKIAQYPSLYQVRRDELKQYKKNNKIDENYFEEIYKADICAGEGYYVASYTYMRRVFENLIKNIFNENQEEIGYSYEDYLRLRMDEKIKTIKPFLPIDDDIYKPLFELLSEGVHGLTEEECAENYGLLKNVLLDILAEFKAKKEKEAKRKEIKQLLAKKKGSNNDTNEG